MSTNMLVIMAGRGGEWLGKCRRKDVTYKGDPAGVDMGVSDVEVSERGTTGRVMMRQKRARGAGLQGPTGTWGTG